MLCVCVGDVMDVVFSVCIVRRGAVGGSCMGECECFVMQMYVCVLCASCGSSQCCVLHHHHYQHDTFQFILLYC